MVKAPRDALTEGCLTASICTVQLCPPRQLGKPFLHSYHLCRTRAGVQDPPCPTTDNQPHHPHGYREAPGSPPWPRAEGVPPCTADLGGHQPLRCRVWAAHPPSSLRPPSLAWHFAMGTAASQNEPWDEAAPLIPPRLPAGERGQQLAWRGAQMRAAAEALAEPGLTFTSKKITPSELRLFWGPRVRHESKRRLPWEPRGCVCCSRVSSLQGLLMSWLTSSQLNVSYAHLRMEPAAFVSSLPFSQLLSSALLLAVPSPPPATPCRDQCWGVGSVWASPGDMWACRGCVLGLRGWAGIPGHCTGAQGCVVTCFVIRRCAGWNLTGPCGFWGLQCPYRCLEYPGELRWGLGAHC